MRLTDYDTSNQMSASVVSSTRITPEDSDTASRRACSARYRHTNRAAIVRGNIFACMFVFGGGRKLFCKRCATNPCKHVRQA